MRSIVSTLKATLHSGVTLVGTSCRIIFSAHGGVLNGALNEPFGYKAQFGYYTDNETGLQLLTFRYYDPSAGRFLTQDPIN